jgi:hypothetical protein
MPINYNLGRAPARKPVAQAPAVGKFALTRQAPLSENARLADDQNLQGLRTGRFADVESARGATDRANALRTSSGLQAARGIVGRSGEMSPEAAIRAQDQAFAAAESQNLNASNGVNQLQRQYRQDALGRAGEIEARDQDNAESNRAYETNRDDERYTRFGLERANTQQQEQQAVTNSQWDKSFGANREDAATQKDQFGKTLGQRDKEFGVTSGQTQQQIDNQKSQFGETLADSRSRFDLTRLDSNSQFDKTFGANREDAATQRDQFGQTLGQRDKEFGVTSGQNQQQINNQSTQFDKTFGAGREDAADNRSRFDLTRADSNSQFDKTFGANREDAATEQGNFEKTFGASREDAAYDKSYQEGRDVIGDTRYAQTYGDQRGDIEYNRENAGRIEEKGDALAAINSIQDPKAKQAAYNAYMNGEDVSQFITGTLYDKYGGLSGGEDSPFASASPGSVAYQAKLDELKSFYPEKSDADIQKMAMQEREDDRLVTRAPAVAAKTELDTQAATKRLDNGQAEEGDFKLAVENGAIPKFTPQTMPIDDAAKALIGKTVSLGGEQFKVVANGRVTNRSGSHTSYTVVQAPDGSVMYNYDGQTSATPPTTKQGRDSGKQAIYDPETGTLSYQIPVSYRPG